MKKTSRILVVGANGMVGSALMKFLKRKGFKSVIGSTRDDTNLLDLKQVSSMYRMASAEYVFMCAGKVGGIKANNEQRVEFMEQNTLIAINTISQAYAQGVKKFLYLGSSCVYPKHTETPIAESSLLTGPLEQTNEPYALAKILGIKLCENYRTQHGADFISCMPCNLFGPGDNYDLDSSHVMAAMIRKLHYAKEENLNEVTFWGTGNPLREFVFVDDLAEALQFLMENYSEQETINVGAYSDFHIKDLADVVAKVIGYKGAIEFDNIHPDGTMRKKVSTSKMSKLGWTPKTMIFDGIKRTYEHYKKTLK